MLPNELPFPNQQITYTDLLLDYILHKISEKQCKSTIYVREQKRLRGLEERQIINYLRKNASNNENQNNIRNKLLSLFYKTINQIPISETIDNYDIILKSFPIYFHNKTREEIIKLFNNEVCPRKPIIYNININYYKIKPNNNLEISTKTFRPIYQDNWKEKTEEIRSLFEVYKYKIFLLNQSFFLLMKIFLLVTYPVYQL